MKRCIILITLVLSAALMSAQETESIQTHSIFRNMPECVRISQPKSVEAGFTAFMENDYETFLSESRKGGHDGKEQESYGIRIFSDNSQNAREASSRALAQFQASYPGIHASRTFSSPFFKVTVGGYNNRADAEAALRHIRGMFPKAYIVRN